MITITYGDKSPITWIGKRQTFVTEISSLKTEGVRGDTDELIELKDAKSQKSIIFRFANFDFQGHGEDTEIAGFRYQSDSGKTLLLIND